MGELRLYPGRVRRQLTVHEQVYRDGTLIIESWNIQSVSTQQYGMKMASFRETVSRTLENAGNDEQQDEAEQQTAL